MKSRRAAVQLFFDGVDISEDLREYLISMTYTDSEEDEADDLQIKLADASGIWRKDWIARAVDTASESSLQRQKTDAAATGDSTAGQYSVTAKIGLNVRTGPGMGYAKLGALSYGATISVQTVSGGWAKFTFNGREAYACADYLKKGSGADGVSPSGDKTVSTGMLIRAVILCEAWEADGTAKLLDCGQFELDSTKLNGPPATVTFDATALPYTASVRQTKKTQAWEAYRLSGIVKEIAERNGMSFLFEAETDPYYERVEQYQSSDIAFLSTLCHNAGLSLKASNAMLVLFDKEIYEAKAAVRTISYGDGSYEKYTMKSGKADKEYSSCRVSYTLPNGQVISATAYIDDYEAGKDSNQQLEITAKVASVSEAEALAKKRLKMQNKYERTASFTLPGDPDLCAGATVLLQGWGYWDGKYMISKAKHSVSTSGYTTQIDLRKVEAVTT